MKRNGQSKGTKGFRALLRRILGEAWDVLRMSRKDIPSIYVTDKDEVEGIPEEIGVIARRIVGAISNVKEPDSHADEIGKDRDKPKPVCPWVNLKMARKIRNENCRHRDARARRYFDGEFERELLGLLITAYDRHAGSRSSFVGAAERLIEEATKRQRTDAPTATSLEPRRLEAGPPPALAETALSEGRWPETSGSLERLIRLCVALSGADPEYLWRRHCALGVPLPIDLNRVDVEEALCEYLQTEQPPDVMGDRRLPRVLVGLLSMLPEGTRPRGVSPVGDISTFFSKGPPADFALCCESFRLLPDEVLTAVAEHREEEREDRGDRLAAFHAEELWLEAAEGWKAAAERSGVPVQESAWTALVAAVLCVGPNSPLWEKAHALLFAEHRSARCDSA